MADSGKTEKPALALATKAAFAILSASFALYALTASPAMGWLDSPEFVAQAASLGIAHSPGHPLPALLGRLATLIPIGDLVWRVNLMSSLCAALAVTLLYQCALLLLRQIAPAIREPSSVLLAASFALFTGCCWALWGNAVRAEVYALQILLTLAALWALLRYEQEQRNRDLLSACLLIALGLANHNFLALVVMLPGLLFVFLRPRRPGLRLCLWAAGIGLLGLLALAYLWIRSLTYPEVNFAAPHTLERFVWTLRGAAFTKSANLNHVSTPAIDAMQTLVALADAVSLPFLLLALCGGYFGLREPGTRRTTALLAGIAPVCIAGRVLLGFDPETPDHHAYLLPAIVCVVLLAVMGLAFLCRHALHAKRPLPKAPALSAVAIALMLPIQLANNWGASNQSASYASDDMAHWELDGLPPNSLLLIAYFNTSFRIWALHTVEGARPDVQVLDRSFLSYPGMDEVARRQAPELAPLIDAPLRAGLPSPVQALRAIAEHRPVLVQLHPNVDMPLARQLHPAGPFARFAEAPPAGADRRARDELETLLGKGGAAEGQDIRGTLLWHDATRLDQLCILGARDEAQKVLADARRIAPDDQMLLQMAHDCGLLP